MTKPKVIEEKPLAMTEVKAMLKKIKKRDGELSYRANKTEEYLGQFDSLNQKQVKELKGILDGLGIPRLKDYHIIKLVDLVPSNLEDVKLVFQSFATLTVSQDNMKKIAKAIDDFVPKKV